MSLSSFIVIFYIVTSDPHPFILTTIKTNSTQFHEILPDNLAEGMRNEGCAAGDHAESQKQSTGHNHSPGSHDDEFVSCSRRHCKKVFTACVFIDYHKKGSHLMSTGWSCGRHTKAISVTLHGILHASKPTILSRMTIQSSNNKKTYVCANLFKLPSKCFRRYGRVKNNGTRQFPEHFLKKQK